MELSSKGGDFIPLEDLAAPFSKNLCEHLKHSDKQITSARSQFLDSCRKANQGEVSSEGLIETTARLGPLPQGFHQPIKTIRQLERF